MKLNNIDDISVSEIEEEYNNLIYDPQQSLITTTSVWYVDCANGYRGVAHESNHYCYYGPGRGGSFACGFAQFVACGSGRCGYAYCDYVY